MQKFHTFDGLKLAYCDEGPRDALPVLCLAGLTRNVRDFDHVAPFLDQIRLIRMDYRGRGQSDHADDPMTYSISVEAQDAIALLDHLDIPRAAILGSSRGGLIAMLLAATAKERLIGICLNDIGPELLESGLEIIRDYIGKPPAFATQAEFAAAKPKLMPGFANVPAQRWLHEVRNQTHQTDTGLALTYDPRLRDAVLAAGETPVPDLWPLFDAMAGLPLALIRGANSNLLSLSTAHEMLARRSDMIFADVPDRGHIPFLDEPQSLGALREWITQCQSQSKT